MWPSHHVSFQLEITQTKEDLNISDLDSERMSSHKVLIFAIHIWAGISLLSAELYPDKYYPLTSHQDWLRVLNKTHQNVKLETVGKSFEGRDLLLLKICNNGRCGKRPVYWIDAGIHAREWIGPAILPYFVEVKIIPYIWFMINYMCVESYF